MALAKPLRKKRLGLVHYLVKHLLALPFRLLGQLFFLLCLYQYNFLPFSVLTPQNRPDCSIGQRQRLCRIQEQASINSLTSTSLCVLRVRHVEHTKQSSWIIYVLSLPRIVAPRETTNWNTNVPSDSHTPCLNTRASWPLGPRASSSTSRLTTRRHPSPQLPKSSQS